ncbi:unnamed protein product (macronuclear) [Paramecium tetraurelia]|uniref:Uncharacterized protein n=1 Tax=Paramecium tetraurelia TaxID=5888 RepID=A0BJP9_PARTE|nr:uncharacterized protein GSPATT00029395001 [Paramecium tetraurelia]CAK58766.1 unnamed protein product [Paramecium tetraurelia]|eukprot:XP_001426164.1 hypothetical protein (macronuclear) [Paramecium tetraurelia strain d4-2]
MSSKSNSINCNKYFSKFGTNESHNIFSGDAVYIQESQEVQINVNYIDALFEDPIYFGLVVEDGKKPETTCLKLKVLYVSKVDHQSSYLISDLPIISSNNSINQSRQYSFKIPVSQLDQNLLLNIINNVYEGCYSIIFESANQEAFQYEFIYNFTITATKDSQKLFDTSFKYKILAEQANSDAPQSELYWCGDFDCISKLNVTPSILINDTFFIKQVILDSEKSKQFLKNTEVWYSGNGFNQKQEPIKINNTIPGQVILQLEATIALSKLNIKVISALSETPSLNNIETTIQIRLKTQFDINGRIRWCTDLTCQTLFEESPNLHFNDLFSFKIHYILDNKKDYYFTDADVWFNGYGLDKKVKPVQFINATLNQVIVQLKAEVVWKSVRIQVQTLLLNPTQEHDPGICINTMSEEITCIKPEGQEYCADYECEVCGDYGFLAFVNMILLAFII